MKTVTIKWIPCLLLALGVSFLLFEVNLPASPAERENHCFTCHTNARKLIKITREIASSQKDKPRAAVKSEGEG